MPALSHLRHRDGRQASEVVTMRRSLTAALLVLILLGLATPAWAQGGQGSEAFVVLSGRAELGSGARVTGDVVSRDAPVVASGATVGGTIRRLQTNPRWDQFGWVGRFAFWLAVSVSTLVVGLVMLWLVGRGAGRILEAGRTRIGASIGWGLLVFFGLPIVAILALVTVVGIPLGIGVLAALGLIYALGYCASAWVLGRLILRTRTAWVVAFLLGWAILRAVALIPILGGLVWFAAAVFGLGTLVVAIWQGRAAALRASAVA